MRQAQVFIYGNGPGRAPTAIDLKKSSLKDLMFNQSPGKVSPLSDHPVIFLIGESTAPPRVAEILPSSKDVALASVSMRPVPFAPLLEKLSLSAGGYGSVPRFYIETADDNTIPLSLQRAMCEADPPARVLRLKGSDHSPFFSKPQALHKLLVEISRIPKNNAPPPPPPPLTQV